MQQNNRRIPIPVPVPQLDSPASEPVPQPVFTAETSDALRSLMDDHRLVVAEFEAAEAQAKQALEAEQARLAFEAEQAKLAQRQIEEAEPVDNEPEDPVLAELFEQLTAAEQRVANAEQQASLAAQQAALAAQQLAVQVSGAVAQPAMAPDPAPASRGLVAALWAGWGLAVIAIAVCAGFYFTSYRLLAEQLAAQTKLIEQQANRGIATEAALRERMDQERAEFREQLSAARASIVAAAANAAAEPAIAPETRSSAADSGKQAARAAKREARLAKKADRAAKLAARSAKRRRSAARTGADGAEDSPTARQKLKTKSAVDDSGSSDPLEGL